ncbi:hypothetical protein BGZ60DRAFT_533248 [Tricladium varicosporioides]|nr:hypothetical protein BGZ60DRAFT_533248 [Hymenoscyphus varicosporioides]
MVVPRIEEDDKLHIILIIDAQTTETMSPHSQSPRSNPMALSNFLNPADKDVEGSTLELAQQQRRASDTSVLYNTAGSHLLSLPIRRRSPNGGHNQRGSSPQFQNLPGEGRRRHNSFGRQSPRGSHTRRYHPFRSPSRSPTQAGEDGESTASKPGHSNRKYAVEEVCWIRYMKEDCGKAWKDFPRLYFIQFLEPLGITELPNDRNTAQCFSSRYYRDNDRPAIDENGNYMIGSNGRVQLVPAKVRDRTTPEGKAQDIPYTLVEKHPERALMYSWVQEVHKEEARAILRGERPGKKEQWRRLLRHLEEQGLYLMD